MKIFLVAFAVACAQLGASHAADQPVIGPAPAWVRPAPAATAPAPAPEDGAAIRVLLSDQQIAFETGRQSVYSETVLKIQTPQGLAAGNISLPWRPDADVLTVHKLVIRRDDQLIDVLASGQTFTVVRREANLENSILDGVLTANIQPEGLQVGDTLEFAATVSSSDPVLKGHVEQFAADWNVVPIDRARMRAQWPADMPMRLRRTDTLPALKTVKSRGVVSVELSLSDLDPVVPPKGAPLRYQMGRLVEMTDFGSWAEVGALMAPLYAKAAIVPAQGPLRTELERIREESSAPKARTAAALALVQDRIRYVALAMGSGGLLPVDAETTWSRRYGDCKGKTALLLALLHELGIAAEPVVVSTLFGDGLDARLPMVGLFDHVLVRAVVDGQTYWLDGTRTGDASLDRLTVPAYGWGLPVVSTGAALVRLMPPPLETPNHELIIRIDAAAGLTVPAPTTIETIIRGDAATAFNLAFANLAGEARDRALRDYWRGQFDFIDVKSTSTSFDAGTGELRLLMEGAARMDWNNGRYKADKVHIGYKADFSRHKDENQDAPFATPYPYYSKTVETVVLPPGTVFETDSASNVNETVAGVEYRRRASVIGNTFNVEKTERSIAPEFPAKDAVAAQARLRELNDHAVYVRAPTGYRPTEQEVTAELQSTPTTAAQFVRRGLVHLDRGAFEDAIEDFDRAHELDPGNDWALANRGLARVWTGEFEQATRDLDAAVAINSRNAVVFRARGLMALHKGEPHAALAAFTTALSIDPANGFALAQRAVANKAVGDIEASLGDSAAALKLDPRLIDLYLLRANIFRSKGRQADALAEAAAAANADPDNPYAHVVAANVYSALDKTDDAMREYDRAIAIKPEPYIYLNRSRNRPKSDIAGRKADIEAALALDATFADAIVAKAGLQADAGDLAGAIKTYTTALKATPGDVMLMSERGLAYARSGDAARAEKDFAKARANATEPGMLNNMCWSKAITGLALQSALADCDAALEQAPDNPAFLDSRGLVLLRLERFDDAIADYDRALAQRPDTPSSLFGRSVALARKGEKDKSDADAAAALKANPDVRTEFESYGVKP